MTERAHRAIARYNRDRIRAAAIAARAADTLTPAERGWETRRMNAEDERRHHARRPCLAVEAIAAALAAGFGRETACRLADHHRRAEFRALTVS